MEDFFKDLKFDIYSRLRNPFVGAFLISWFSWNFSLVILFVGKGEFDKKIGMIECIYPNHSYWTKGLLCPFVTATIFVLLYPFLDRYASLYWDKRQSRTKQLQIENSEKTPISEDEIKELKKGFMRTKKTWRVILRDLKR